MAEAKSKQRTKYKKKKFLGYFIFSLIGVVILLGLAVFVLGYIYNTTFYPKAKIAGAAVGKMTQEQAKIALDTKISEYKKTDLVIACGSKKKKVHISDLKAQFDSQKTIDNFFALGHPETFGDIFKQIPQIVKLLIFRQNMPLVVNIQNTDLLEKDREDLSTLPKDAQIYLDNNEVKIKDEENGFGISEQEMQSGTTDALSFLQNEVPFSPKILKPTINKELLTNIMPRINEFLGFAPIKLKVGDKVVYLLEKEDLIKLLGFKVSLFRDVSFSINDAGKGEIYADIKKTVDIAPKSLRLSKDADGKISILQKDEEGKTLDENDLTQNLDNFFADPKETEIKLFFEKSLAAVNKNNYKKFDFNDLLGKGETTFYGSSVDRVTNIDVGSKAINGVVVDVGQTFSLGESLGDVSEAAGYKNGWVIKGDTVASELGGGLCQIATTMFRAALYSGFPIVERYNHAYRVVYYEPPVGMDATIYYPQLDFKFKNDTSAPILIQTAVENYKATYYIYGKSDGRKVEISTPQVYNETPAPKDPKYMDDSSLPKGTEMILDSAHPGADASFDYKVYRDNKIIYQEQFVSHYEAWPQIIRRGTKE